MRSFPDAEAVSEQVLKAANHHAPPTDLKAVCSLWPQLDVTEEALEKAGYLIPLGVHGAEVLLRKSDPLVRKHFTLAHELGHWVFANLESGHVRYGRTNTPNLPFLTEHKSTTPEEMWCNRFASCLLMPRNDIQRYLGDIVVGNVAAKISVGHTTFRVSQEAFLTRVPQITPIDVFEVVSFDGKVRVRRRFLRDHDCAEAENLLINEFLQNVDPTDSPASLTFTTGDHQIGAALIRNSFNLRSWLVTATPKSCTFSKSC